MEPPVPSGSGSAPPSRNGGRGSESNRGTSRGRASGCWRGRRRGYHQQSNVAREKPVTFALSTVPADSPTPSALSISICNESAQLADAGWKLYFPAEDYRSGSRTVRNIRTMLQHFIDHADNDEPSAVKPARWFELNLGLCENDESLRKEWPTMRQDLIDNPEHTLACLGRAKHDLLTRSSSGDSLQQSAQLSLRVLRPRIVGFGPAVSIGSIQVDSIGKLVAVRGAITRVGAAQIMHSWSAFRCGTCGNQQVVQQKSGIYTLPTACHSGCNARTNFVPLPRSMFTRLEPYQTVWLQERMQGSGAVVKSIEVELMHELVDSVSPGDDVTITGILKVRSQDAASGTGKHAHIQAYVQTVNVRSNNSAVGNWNRSSEFSDLDLEAIRMIQSEPSPFRLLVHSLCPTIFGQELVKAGYLLGLFGGHATGPGKRPEIHVLVVGDPGIGKSQILKRCATLSPRGIFVCGTNSSIAGLTVTVTTEKDEGPSFEAGALVLAHQGVCCIDELDKMANPHALVEVMEQRSVSVAKAGVICNVPARTTVLAAANPVDGHYNKTKTVSENLKLHPALLSRFDLVIIVSDRSNERTDKIFTAHIQKVNGMPSTSTAPTPDASGSASCDGDEEPTIEQRLRLAPGEQLDLLPEQLVQKYIGYARNNVQPQLTAAAADKLRNFYLELRRAQSETDMNPVTNRQLEGLVRLTQARAKIDLSREATVEHVRDVMAIFRQSVQDVCSAGDADLPSRPDQTFTGSVISTTAAARKFAVTLRQLSASTGSRMFTTGELRKAMAEAGICASSNEVIDTLNCQGYLLKKSRDLYQFMNE